MTDDWPEVMRNAATAYFQLAALTKIPELATEFRAKGHILHAKAVLMERDQRRAPYTPLA